MQGNMCDCNQERSIQAMEAYVYMPGHQKRRQVYRSWSSREKPRTWTTAETVFSAVQGIQGGGKGIRPAQRKIWGHFC